MLILTVTRFGFVSDDELTTSDSMVLGNGTNPPPVNTFNVAVPLQLLPKLLMVKIGNPLIGTYIGKVPVLLTTTTPAPAYDEAQVPFKAFFEQTAPALVDNAASVIKAKTSFFILLPL
jgi:hypothetical protein